MRQSKILLGFIFIALISCNKPQNKGSKNDYKTPNAKVVTLAKTTNTWDGTKIAPLNIKNPQVTSLRITIKKGEKLPLHKHPVLNVGYLLKGTLTVYKHTGEKKVLKAGEVLLELINQWHYGANETDEDAVIVVTYIAEKNAPLTLLKNK